MYELLRAHERPSELVYRLPAGLRFRPIKRRVRWFKFFILPSVIFSLWYFQVDPILLDNHKDDDKVDKFDGFSKIETNGEALTSGQGPSEEVVSIKGEIVRRLQVMDGSPAASKESVAHTKMINVTQEQQKEVSHTEEKVAEDSLQGHRQNGLPVIPPSETTEPAKQINSEIPEINRKIKRANHQQEILNSDKFSGDFKYVIAVQVHNRIEYLRHLVASLAGARHIDQTLLVFSHDVYQEDINSLVRSINFTRVMQIFYPFSLQTHPYAFPGESAKDCPRDAKKDEAEKLQCINKDWPDIYGHYREAKFTQTKHHWWWKANHIFRHLNATSDYQGLVVYLEEDHLVTEDFLHVLSLMYNHNVKLSQNIQANMYSLGTYLKKFNYKENTKQVQYHTKLLVKEYSNRPITLEMTQWVSSLHNMGMALTRSTWDKILQCQNHFCQYDDYNWDWSLLYVSLNCLREKLQVLVSKGPRIFHIGECGVHHKKKNCGASSAALDKVKFIINATKKFFFPDSVRMSTRMPRRKIKLKKSNGGWGDIRDHQLCLNFSSVET